MCADAKTAVSLFAYAELFLGRSSSLRAHPLCARSLSPCIPEELSTGPGRTECRSLETA